MTRYGKWETFGEPLGGGGQGTVYLACNTEEFDQERVLSSIWGAITLLGTGQYEEQRRLATTQLASSLEKYINRFQPSHVGALKVLHGMGPSADADEARERMIREVAALRTVAHPNLLRVLDADVGGDQKWFVGEYHELGTLSKHPDRFRGDMLASLKAFRPVVEGVAKLHEAHIAHRDIKPKNVFLATDGRLVLGDMGLVFFLDEEKSRVTEKYENVGSRDWMPGWALGMRVEDIRRSFDVFCLGKLFWFMLSGRSLLRLWYWQKPEFDVEKQFPADPSIKWARFIFERCVVENEQDCLPTAGHLLEEIDRILLAVSRSAQVIRDDAERVCLVCGLGTYRKARPNFRIATEDFGLNPRGGQRFRIFECSHCGHVQLFSFPHGEDSPPPAWSTSRGSL